MIYLFNKGQELIEEIGAGDTITCLQSMELGGQGALDTSYPYRLHKKEAAYIGHKFDNIFYLYKIIDQKIEGRVISIKGIHVFFDDLKGIVIRDKRPYNASLSSAMSAVLEGSGWTFRCDVTTTASTNFYYVSALEAFYEAMKTWGGEFRLEMAYAGGKITKKEVIIKPHISGNHGKWFEYGDKLLKVVAESSWSGLSTAFIGRGKGEQIENGEQTSYGRKITFKDVYWSVSSGDPVDKPKGQDYVEIQKATSLYGYPDGRPRTSVVDFENCEDPAELLRLTYDYALKASRPKLQLQADAISEERVELGETCAVIRPDLDIRYKTRVFRIKNDVTSGRQSFDFGEELVQSAAYRAQQTAQEQKKKNAEYESYIDKLSADIVATWKNEDGFNYELKAGNDYHLPAGYYSFDKPIDQNPTKVIGVSAGRLVISNQKNPDGTWRFSTFGTGDGFTANLIEAGVIRGGSSQWNLETGYLNVGNKLVFDPSRGGLSIASDAITLSGDTTVLGTFKVPTSAVIGTLSADRIDGGTINASRIKVKNLDADYITDGTLRRGVDNGSCTLPERGSAYLSGSGTNLDTGSSKFQFIYSGSYENTFLVDGRITAQPLSGQHMSFQAGGLYVGANGGRVEFNPGSSGVNIRSSGPYWFDDRISCSGLTIGSATLTESDINKLRRL